MKNILKMNHTETEVLEKLQNKVEEVVRPLQDQVDRLQEKQDGHPFQTKQQTVSLINETLKNAVGLLESVKKTRYGKADIEIKSGVIDMGITTSTGAGVVLGDREPGISSAPKRKPIILDNIQVGTTNSNTVEWVEKTDEEGNPAFRKEFETLPNRSWKTVLKQSLVKKIGVNSDHSKEIMEDVESFRSELQSDLVEQIQLVLDHNLLYGTGGGSDDQDNKGILQHAQAWSNTVNGEPYTVDNPNIFDVIAIGLNQIEEEHHMPSVILMRPSTALEMQLSKDKNGMYVLPPFTSNNGLVVKGLPVVTNTLLNPKEIVLMDGTKAKYFFKRNWQLEISDSHDDNFTKDVITVKLTGRGAIRIKETDAKAFVHISNVDTAILSLTGS